MLCLLSPASGMRAVIAMLALWAVFAATPGAAQATYCATSITQPCGATNEFISFVTIGAVAQASVCGSGYENYTSSVVSLPATVPTPITVIVSNAFSGDAVYVYCDWNGNGVLNDPGEVVQLQASAPFSPVFTGLITIPTTSVAQTRMRVVLDYYPPAGGRPCGPHTYGNVEDYTIARLTPPAPNFQVNQPGAAFSINSVIGSGFTAAAVALTADNVCSFGACTAGFASTNTGHPWELGVTSASAVPNTGGGYTTAGNQQVNLDLGDPTFGFLNGGGFATVFTGPFTVGLAPGGPLSAAAQFLVLDAGIADGFALSQPTNLTISLAPPGVAVPNTDDGALVFNLGAMAATLCQGPTTFPFYGTNHTQIAVSANGRITFGGVALAGDYAPTVTGVTAGTLVSADAGPPMVGAWCDFNSTLTVPQPPVISVSTPTPGILHVAFTGDPYYGQPGGPFATFGITLDGTTGTASVNGIRSFGIFTGAAPSQMMFLGISAGAAGAASDGGAASFAPGVHAAPAGHAMVYQFGQAGTLAGAGTSLAVDVLTFVPTGTNYSVTGS